MLAVAFEGCACRAAFHAGVAAGLAEAGLPIAMTAGASSGSLSAAALALGMADELPRLWLQLAGRKVVSLRRLFVNRSPFDMSHLVRGAVLGAFGAHDFRRSPIEALATVTELPTWRAKVHSSHQAGDFIEVLMGSCFFPVLYGRPVKAEGRWVLDGGLTDNLPIEALRDRGATDILAVVIDHRGVAFKDARRRAWSPVCSGAKLHVIHPPSKLALRSWELGPDNVARAIDTGYKCARDFLGV